MNPFSPNQLVTPGAPHRSNPSAQAAALADRSAFGEAFERRHHEISAVEDDDLAPLNLDVHAAVTTVLGSIPEIRQLAGAIEALPGNGPGSVDALEDYAHAVGEASSLYATAAAAGENIAALNEVAVKMRELIRSDAHALATRGLIDRARLAPFKGLVGYKNVAFELIDWANLMRDCWSAIEGKTALTAEEIAEAKELGTRLVHAVGLREQGPAQLSEAARTRQQAVTLLVRAYDQIRRTVVFLRWNEGDADAIAPSLYAGRSRHRKDADEAVPEAPSPSTALSGAALPSESDDPQPQNER